jgi:hypothetical protein
LKNLSDRSRWFGRGINRPDLAKFEVEDERSVGIRFDESSIRKLGIFTDERLLPLHIDRQTALLHPTGQRAALGNWRDVLVTDELRQGSKAVIKLARRRILQETDGRIKQFLINLGLGRGRACLRSFLGWLIFVGHWTTLEDGFSIGRIFVGMSAFVVK